MRLHKRKPTNHRRATAAPIVQTPTMARRPRSGAPAPTVLMAAIPAAPRAIPDFHDPSPLPGLKSLTAKDGLTVILPAVRDHWSAEDATATQILPRVSADVPPSAQHADPARLYYQRTFVEDDGMEPPTRGRHVLDELKALPDPAQALAAAPARIMKALGGPEPEVKDPTRRLSVRLFRAARDMGRTREAHNSQDDVRLTAADARIKAFAQRWAHDDAHWDRVAAALVAKQKASDAGQLTQVYEGDGTAAALYKVEELSQLIVQRARANAGVR